MKMTEQAFAEMLKIQHHVNEEINLKLEELPEIGDYVLAFNVELFEFINAVGIWKWWKHGHKIQKERVLDELADCYAFALSAILKMPEEVKRDDQIEYPRVALIKDLIDTYDKISDLTNSQQATALDIIYMLGTASELDGDKHIGFITAFAAANVIAAKVLEGLTWDEVIAAYEKKSKINIVRQEENY